MAEVKILKDNRLKISLKGGLPDKGDSQLGSVGHDEVCYYSSIHTLLNR